MIMSAPSGLDVLGGNRYQNLTVVAITWRRLAPNRTEWRRIALLAGAPGQTGVEWTPLGSVLLST